MVLVFVVSCFTYCVHIVCQNYVSGCPSTSQYDYLAEGIFVRYIARLVVNTFNIDSHFILLLAHIGKIGYFVVAGLLGYYTIKVNLEVIGGIFKCLIYGALVIFIGGMLITISSKFGKLNEL